MQSGCGVSRISSCEVSMGGGVRLMIALFFLLAGGAYAARNAPNNSKDNTKDVAAPAVPKAEKRPLEETLHGVKIVDNYRWLEDGSNPDTQKWVAEEMAYTREVLDLLPGRDAIHKRLTDLLRIGSMSEPQIGGKYYFYSRRDGMQNQPVLYVREGVDGKDRVLV